jgi:hypothetical protein
VIALHKPRRQNRAKTREDSDSRNEARDLGDDSCPSRKIHLSPAGSLLPVALANTDSRSTASRRIARRQHSIMGLQEDAGHHDGCRGRRSQNGRSGSGMSFRWWVRHRMASRVLAEVSAGERDPIRLRAAAMLAAEA